jgi:acetyl esterase/lipase
VEVLRDQTYGAPGGTPLLADVYLPPGLAPGARRPAVLLLHGGVPDELPYRPKDWGVYRSWGRLLGAAGLVGVAFNQRVATPDPRLPLAAQDLDAMLAWLRQHAEALHVDPDRVCLAAFSAGGPLLASFISRPRPAVRCLVAFYAYLDVRQSEQHRAFMKPAELDAFSPAAQLAAGAARMPPMLVARGGRDEVGSVLASEDRFIAEAIRTNAPVEILNHPAAPHGFDNGPDDGPEAARSRAILGRTVAFLRESLDPAGQ